ncbi:MAG: hypothetical protein AB8F95_02270 [Bacteroidia bacterium]
MEKVFDILNSIQPVDAPDHLYDQVMGRVNQSRLVPMGWIGLAAALCFLLISVDVYCLMIEPFQSVQNPAETITPVTNNGLYYD